MSRWAPPELHPDPPAPTIQPATDAELDSIADIYADYMVSHGHSIGRPERMMIRRMAAIQDAWRVAFGRVLG